MEQWSFLAPWTSILKGRFCHTVTETKGGILGKSQVILQVNIPNGPIQQNTEDRNFTVNAQTTLEGLKLLAAVAHVDYEAWKYLLVQHCGVVLGHEGDEKFESEILIRYQLKIFCNMDTYVTDLVQICGARQHDHPRRVYLQALERIAAMNKNFWRNRSEIDIEIPVQVMFSPNLWRSEGQLDELMMIRDAEKLIIQEWKEKRPILGRQSLQCKFILEPMVADFGDYKVDADMAQKIESLVLDNVWFSSISLRIDFNLTCADNERLKKQVFGQLMSRLFDSTRRSREIGCYQTNSTNKSRTQQLNQISLVSRGLLQPKAIEAMCSAMVQSQIAREVSLRFIGDFLEHGITWWKWLAYTFFSNQARTCSSFEKLALTWIKSMSITDIEAFCRVLVSNHPEEELFNCSRGLVDENDATLVANAPIRWEFDTQVEPAVNSHVLTFSSPVTLVSTFSDNGESKWVNVIVPGYGRCLVQRENLVLHERKNHVSFCQLKSLEIGFDKTIIPETYGLPLFLSTVGRSLQILTIDAVSVDVDVNMILERCPNLQTLYLRKRCVNAKFNFAEYQAKGLLLPTVSLNFEDISALAEQLRDAESGLTKYLQRLEVHQVYVSNNQTISQRCQGDLTALLLMLETNQRLEYFRLIMHEKFCEYVHDFRKYHLTSTNQFIELPVTCKLAFLSVLSSSSKKKRHVGQWQTNLHGFAVDAIAIIFLFAGAPVLREVFIELF